MGKLRWPLIILAALFVTIGITACDLPDYQLEWELDITNLGNGEATVYVENVGFKDLTNVEVKVSVVDSDGYILSTTTVDFGDLDVNEDDSEDVAFGIVAGADSMQVTSVGWDGEDSW